MFIFTALLNIIFQMLKKMCNFNNCDGNGMMKMHSTAIRDIEPSTSHPPRNVYHMNVSLYVLDVVRLFQDHPKYAAGLQENHIVGLLAKEDFACGDVEAQVRMALKELTTTGFVRPVQQGYRTLGPFAKLALARTPRQFNMAWDRLCELQKTSCTSIQTAASVRPNPPK